MAFWWITGPVDFAVTAFLPIALNALFNMASMSTVIANYASETILLLLGASILTVSWEETGLELDPDNGTLVLCNREPNCFKHVWVFRQDVDLDALQLQEGETCDAILVTRDQLLRLRADDMLVPYKYLAKLFDYIDSHR